MNRKILELLLELIDETVDRAILTHENEHDHNFNYNCGSCLPDSNIIEELRAKLMSHP